MSLPNRTFVNGKEPALSAEVMNEIYENVRNDEEQIKNIKKDLPYPLAIQDGVYGYIKREAGADTFCPFNDKLYLTVQNKLANKITVLSSFVCTDSSDKYDITVIPYLEKFETIS